MQHENDTLKTVILPRLAAIITGLRDENDTLNNRLEEANARLAGVPPAFVNRQIDDESLGSLFSEY